MKTEFIYVSPKSNIAKNRFANSMDKLHSCRVQSRKNGKVFLASINKKYFFCIPECGDENWEIIK
jgi:hypothetical protein